MDSILSSDTKQPPVYLQNSDIRMMFHWFLDRLDDIPAAQRTNRISRVVSPKYFQRLFEPDEPDDDEVFWKLILRCQADGLIRISSDKKRRDPDQPPWSGKRIIFRRKCEASLRKWLNRPVITPDEVKWCRALKAHAAAFVRPDLIERPVFTGTGKSPEQIISRLAAIPELVKDSPLTVRHLSAKLFWGDSKVLDGREQWLCDLLGLPRGAVAERILPVEVTFPFQSPAGVLMLENLDAYFSACIGNWPDCKNLIKIYTQGFRGTAIRIRNPACARLHFSDQNSPASFQLTAFCNDWFRGGTFAYPVYFCGDMDWAGLSIFRALKPVFSELKPWKPGYKLMLHAAKQGDGHTLKMAGKTGQTPIETTRNAWLDTYVLSFLKSKNIFVDQEVIG
jgi:hypothetical protein